MGQSLSSIVLSPRLFLVTSAVYARTSPQALQGILGLRGSYGDWYQYGIGGHLHHDWSQTVIDSSGSDVALPPLPLPLPRGRLTEHQTKGFRWSDIKPSSDLVFHPCFDGFDCARLAVPLDWNSTKDEPETDSLALAIVRVPAKVPITDPRYGGVILHNPGGPSSSGVALTLSAGRLYQSMFDPPSATLNESHTDTSLFYDFLSWDPRAVNNTTPFVNCIPDIATFNQWASYYKPLGAAETSFEYLWARQQAFAQSCASSLHSSPAPNIFNYASSTDVVFDMIAIIERFGAWRERQAKALKPTDFALHARLAHKKGEEPLNYYGVSYGTLLGATFAAMQPHRVRRLVLDGVMDASDWYEGGWDDREFSIMPTIDRLLTYCFMAGRSCELVATAQDAGWEVEEREDLRKVWQHIECQFPLAVPSTADSRLEVITATDFNLLVLQAAYTSATMWPKVIEIIAPLIYANGTAFAKHKHRGESDSHSNATAKTVGPREPRCPHVLDPHSVDCASENQGLIAFTAIAAIECLDRDFSLHNNRTAEDFEKFLDRALSKNPILGGLAATRALSCVGWPGRTEKTRFKRGDGSSRDIASNVTAHPILWVGNEMDIATPIHQAVSMQRRFKDSVLMTVQIEGHASTANPSLSAARAVRNYFQTGQLPDPEEKHLPHMRVFLGSAGPNVEPLPDKLDSADQELLDALTELLRKRSSWH